MEAVVKSGQITSHRVIARNTFYIFYPNRKGKAHFSGAADGCRRYNTSDRSIGQSVSIHE